MRRRMVHTAQTPHFEAEAQTVWAKKSWNLTNTRRLNVRGGETGTTHVGKLALNNYLVGLGTFAMKVYRDSCRLAVVLTNI